MNKPVEFKKGQRLTLNGRYVVVTAVLKNKVRVKDVVPPRNEIELSKHYLEAMSER